MKPVAQVLLDENGVRSPNPRTVVLEQALHELERELRRPLNAIERPAVIRVLERFADDWDRSRRWVSR